MEQKSRIIIVNHEFATGLPQNLEEYLLKKRINSLLYIRHPLFYQKNDHGSGFRFYKKGVLSQEFYLQNKKRPAVWTYIVDFLLNLWWVIKTKQSWDLYIGSNNLNAFSGFFLQKLGLVKKTAFYTVDFIPNRFPNKLLNSIYLWLDKFCVKNCDQTWIVSPRMRKGRHQYLHLDKKYDKKQILVPEGVWLKRIKRQPFEKIKRHTVVFVGHLVERMGLQKVIEAIPLIIKKIPDFKLIVIGKGDYGEILKKLTKKLKIENHVVFTGFIKDHQEVEKIIASCAVGVACYQKSKDSFTYYAEPSKTKIYLGAGLPVVMTDMFYNANDIEKAGAGKVVEYDKISIAEGILAMITNPKKLKSYKRNALRFIQEFDWNLIFEKTLGNVND